MAFSASDQVAGVVNPWPAARVFRRVRAADT
jgi:hypothetical protein